MFQQIQIPQANPSKYVELINGKPTTTSMIIAKEFEKRHDHVMRDIKSLEIPNDFRLPNFGETQYIDSQGREQRMYHVTRNGFMLLAMGFTGKKAMSVKLAFIHQFDALESRLKEITDRPALPAPAPEPAPALRLDRVLSLEEHLDLMRFKINTLERENRIQQVALQYTVPKLDVRRNRRTMTDLERTGIISLYNQGYSVNAIATKMHRHRESINRVLDQATNKDQTGMIDLSDAIEPGDEGQNGASWRNE